MQGTEDNDAACFRNAKKGLNVEIWCRKCRFLYGQKQCFSVVFGYDLDHGVKGQMHRRKGKAACHFGPGMLAHNMTKDVKIGSFRV